MTDHRSRALESIHAIYAQEKIEVIEAKVWQASSDLSSKLLAGEVYDTARWDRWESCYAAWRSYLDEWLEVGTWYALAVKERTNTIDDQKYEAKLKIEDNQFPNADAVRRFKKFAIVNAQWNDVIPDVKSGMHQVAYMGLTEKEARSGRPAG